MCFLRTFVSDDTPRGMGRSCVHVLELTATALELAAVRTLEVAFAVASVGGTL